MPVKNVFCDDDNNELECFVNDKNMLYLSASDPFGDFHNHGYIVLNLDGAILFQRHLNKVIKELKSIK